jgi:hypothetical protein
MSLDRRTILLVGDRFAGFAVHDDVFTVTQFRDALLLGAVAWDVPVTVRAGQGVAAADWASVCDQAALLGLEDAMEFAYLPVAPSPQREVHKKVPVNTLIADLRQEGEGRFVAALRLHNDNELLLDHQTGQHVQGMVAVEAARQMFLAVSERFYASRHPDRSYYYVIESMNTDFENFLFPLDATVEFVTGSAHTDDPSRLSFTAEISVHQAGRRAARTSVAYTAFEPGLIGAKETRRAQHAVAHQAAPHTEFTTAA